MDRVGRLSFGDEASRYGHQRIFPNHPTHHLVLRRHCPSVQLLEVSDAISRLQQEKTRIQKNLDQKKAKHDALTHNMYLLRNERDFLHRKMIRSSS